MNRYRVTIKTTSVPWLEQKIEVEAESVALAREKVAAEHPDMRVASVFRVDVMREVPKKRSRNSRYHLADVDKMGADGASPMRFGR